MSSTTASTSVIVTLVVAVFAAGAMWWNERRKRSRRLTLVLAGQSNMAGRGGLLRNSDLQAWEFHPKSTLEKRLARENGFQAADLRTHRLNVQGAWETPACEPLHIDVDVKKTCGIGPGLVLADHLVHHHPSLHVNLIPAAVGGSGSREWMNGLYSSMRERVAKIDAPDVFLWYQGETDALHEEDSGLHYEAFLRDLFAKVRSDFGKNIVIVVILITGVAEKLPFLEQVRQSQRNACLQDGRVLTVDALGCELRQDQIHLSTAGQVELARRIVPVLRDQSDLVSIKQIPDL